jgi:MFS family permease
VDVLVIALYLVAAVAVAYACARLAARRGRSPRAWAVLGILFPLAAVILVAILPPPRRDED